MYSLNTPKPVHPMKVAARVAVVGTITVGAFGLTACQQSPWFSSHGHRYCRGTLEQCAQTASANAIKPGQRSVTLQARGSSWS